MVIIKSFACVSDVRVRKIIEALIKGNKEIHYSGVYHCDNPHQFQLPRVNYSLLKRKVSVITLLKASFLDLSKLLKAKNGDTIYFIDESIAIILFPFLIYLKIRKVNLVIDLFDSYYLKYNKNSVVFLLLKVVFFLFDKVIVTDLNRAKMMSKLISPKQLMVIENFPFYNGLTHKKKYNDNVVLFFYGSLHESRGWNFIRQFAEQDGFQVLLAGWNNFSLSPLDNLPSNFNYLGLLNQSDTLNLMSTEVDWVFCLYEPSNINNINASPNKTYDAIHCGCGVIMNREVKLSDFIIEKKLGLVIDTYYDKISNYLTILKKKQFKIVDNKEELIKYSFDQYLDFYKSL